MKQLVGNFLTTSYAFSAAAGTITISNRPDTLVLEDLLAVINVTDQEIIYQPNKSTKGATLAGSTFTLEYDTTGMSDTDDLMILIDVDESFTEVGTTATNTTSIDGKTPSQGTAVMAGSVPVTIATDDTQYGAVGAAADVDGNIHGQLRYIGEAVDGLEATVPTPSATHKSPNDFTAAYTSTTTITLSGYQAISDNSQLVYIKYIPTGGSGSAVLVNGQNGVTITQSAGVLTVNGAGTPFASGDVYEVGINYQDKAYDKGLDVNKIIPQANAPKLAWSEAYTTFAPADINYDEGAVIDVRADKAITLKYSKTAANSDNTSVKVIGLDTASGTVDYQETVEGASVGGKTPVETNVYILDKAASVGYITIPTNGNNYMRIDMAKETDIDTGSDSTITCVVGHEPR